MHQSVLSLVGSQFSFTKWLFDDTHIRVGVRDVEDAQALLSRPKLHEDVRRACVRIVDAWQANGEVEVADVDLVLDTVA